MKRLLFRGYHYPMSIYWDNLRKGGFTQLSLDLSSTCNYRCDWCFNKHLINKPEPGILTLKEKRDLIKASVDLGVKSIVFPGTGEPTLDRDFCNLVDYISSLGLTTVVYTNLTGVINRDLIVYLFERDVSIGIKLDSFDSNYFQIRYHVIKRVYDLFRENLSAVLEVFQGSAKTETREDGLYEIHRIVANMVLTYENEDELPQITEFCTDNNLPLFIRPVKPVNWARDDLATWEITGNITGEMSPDNKLIALANHHNTLFSPSSTPENHCAIYSFGVTIKSNGDIQICPDHHDSRGVLGDIRDVSLKELGDKLNNMRIIKPGYCVMLSNISHEA